MEAEDDSSGKSRPVVLLMGQTPPPWHGQAVATQILFEHDWREFEVHRLRMEFSEEMVEVGQFSLRKLGHLFRLIREARRGLRAHPDTVLFYPPASANWVPFFRDAIFLMLTRHLAGKTVFIYHASGLPLFARAGWMRARIARKIYGNAEVSLEVSEEKIPPHKVFRAQSWRWCPCAIEVPEEAPVERAASGRIEVLFVGSLQEGKGVLEILRTAARLREMGRESDFRFRIVGRWFSAEFEREARALHRELELGEMVEFAGQLTGDEKWRAYARANVFFFPTHYASEATPIVLMEALGMGLPIITTDWAGIPAMLEGAETARVLPVRAPGEYARALAELADQPRDPGDIRRAAREYYLRHYKPERFVERVADAFRADGMVGKGGSKLLSVTAYLADQNPQLGRSLGISRMSDVVLGKLAGRDDVALDVVTSRSSVDGPAGVVNTLRVPWSTRSRPMRIATDHAHPLFFPGRGGRDLWYYPKGFMPKIRPRGVPAVATIHDTIIQYYQDHFPRWRMELEYGYWAGMLKNTLTRASAIMTVSENARDQIEDFMRRHGLPEREIHVTYEPCLYEDIPQPENPAKAEYVLHLGSREPHKRTEWLIRLWIAWAAEERVVGRHGALPKLHVVGSIPPSVTQLAKDSPEIVFLPFLENSALVSQFTAARALIFPSEVEGFGLPAIEAYYLGTPVCHVRGTSVEEVLAVATDRGGFDLERPATLARALEDVLDLGADEIRRTGLELRDHYSARRVVERIMKVFDEVIGDR